MNDNMFMALSTSVVNAAALAATSVIWIPAVTQGIMASSGILSPFLSLWLLKVYVRFDDPVELTRIISSLKSSISVCKAHLKDNSSSEEFKQKTRIQLEDFQTKLQNARADFEKGRTHTVTPFSTNETQSGE
ncbi:hypothetical protein YA0086_15820 [Pseudomonas amygdali]|uniref:hypothetical protein n=1 Tax=Pseudomonas amygdali TaxID=47877 RepID=UPI0018E615EC|nr:hypothetical protein [Pseudomonas amygdali]MBI6730588.1 hypothetical protein [Pseudomonas amygdali]